MGRSCNVPDGHTEQARFLHVGTTPIPTGAQRAVQISFFVGYEAGAVTHYIACHYQDTEGRSSWWSKACNGRNKARWYDANLQECREDPNYEEVVLDALAYKADWQRFGKIA